MSLHTQTALFGSLLLVVSCATDPERSPQEPASPTAVLLTPTQQPLGVVPSSCDMSYLDYASFGAPFDVNFDTPDEVRAWAPRIVVRAATTPAKMPPAGGPTADERALLAEWITCGAP